MTGKRGRSGRKKKYKIDIDQRKDPKGYLHAYHEKRHELDDYLAAAKAIAPPPKKKGQEWSF